MDLWTTTTSRIVPERAADPVELIGGDHVQLALAGVVEEALDRRAVKVLAGEACVLMDLGDLPALLALHLDVVFAGIALGVQGAVLGLGLLVGRDSGVDGAAYDRVSVAGWMVVGTIRDKRKSCNPNCIGGRQRAAEGVAVGDGLWYHRAD